jgi:hypothetical protein
LDELAADLGEVPCDFRLELLPEKAGPVLELVAAESHWGTAEAFERVPGPQGCTCMRVEHSEQEGHVAAQDQGARKCRPGLLGQWKEYQFCLRSLRFTAPGNVVSVNWSPDGNHVIAAGWYNTPLIRRAWQSTEALIAQAKQCCVARELTPEERQQFGLPER